MKIVSAVYLKLRSVGRAAVLGVPWLDRHLGRALVTVDIAFRRTGILRDRLKSGTLIHDHHTIRFDPTQPDEVATLLTNGSYEPETLSAILAVLPPGGTFVDLGAHVGLFTLEAARKVGANGMVYAFEPTPHIRELLTENVRQNGYSERVAIEPLAISDQAGVVSFSVVPGASQANSITQPGDTVGTILVSTTTLDAYFESKGWPRVDVIKMDIEGQELSAMRTMRNLAARNPHLSLIFEYHKGQLRRSGTAPQKIFELLGEMGFNDFQALFRRPIPLDGELGLLELDRLADRANVNVLVRRVSRTRG